MSRLSSMLKAHWKSERPGRWPPNASSARGAPSTGCRPCQDASAAALMASASPCRRDPRPRLSTCPRPAAQLSPVALHPYI